MSDILSRIFEQLWNSLKFTYKMLRLDTSRLKILDNAATKKYNTTARKINLMFENIQRGVVL